MNCEFRQRGCAENQNDDAHKPADHGEHEIDSKVEVKLAFRDMAKLSSV
jgi:hypothetical protein